MIKTTPIKRIRRIIELLRRASYKTEPEKVLKIGQPHIIQCCKGKRKTAGGFKWRYKN